MGEELPSSGGPSHPSLDRGTDEALLDRERRLRKQNEVLVALGRSQCLEQGDLPGALREITEAASRTLGVARASIWLYAEDHGSIRCLDLYDITATDHASGTELFAKDFPGYFRALDEERTIAAHDAHTDPRTSEFSVVYLKPLGIDAMLDAPIRHGGKMVGVVCQEHVGGARTWSVDEQTFAGSLADSVSLAIASSERRKAERALAERIEELARSNAELEQFAYVASHDLQEPLRMVSSYVSLLERKYKGKLDADADKYIAYAVEGSRRMSGLINDLLEFSRVGRDVGAPEIVDMLSVLADVVSDLDHVIKKAGASVTADSLPTVRGYPTLLGQLLRNLVENAIKYHGEEAPKVHLTAVRKGAMWELSVKDNGIGIEPQYFDRIFRIFQRLHERGRYEGSGIGLSIARRIAEHHGGRIWVTSEQGHGSTFHFTLPAV